MDAGSTLTAALAGRYLVEREIGSGGMATVYLARDLRHDRRVALKVLRPELAAVIGAQRFLAEIKTTANLQHPHILALFDSGEVDGTVFYVMPFVEGESLRDRLGREKQLPIDDALRIAMEVANALDYAHRHGVIHRDIKPENILLHDGQALVADFGIALAVANTGESRLTETGLSLGTPKYMSPEQAMGERTLDARTDVYALGCVLYEMLTGEPPFTGPTAQAIVARVLTEVPRPVHEVRRTVPAHIEAAILGALEKLPADRFATTADFADALAGRSAPPPRQPRTQAAPSRRAAILAAALGATTLLALAWGFRQSRLRPATTPAPVIRFQFPANLSFMSSGAVVAISPDGSKVAIVEFLPGGLQTHLVVRHLDQEQATPIPGSEGALSPFFSPDGAWVAFADGTRLKRARVNAGAENATVTTIADIGGADLVGGGSWGTDGTIVFASRDGRLYRVPAASGTAERIAAPVGEKYNWPIWLPGGERILVSVGRRGVDFEMVVMSVADGRILARLGPGLAMQYVNTGDLVYHTPDGTLMTVPFDARTFRRSGTPIAFPAPRISYHERALMTSVSSTGTVIYAFLAGGSAFANGELLRVTADRSTTVLPVGVRGFRGPRFSPDGRRIVVEVESGVDLVRDIWLFDQVPGTFTRLTFEGSSVFPEWTPDGSAVLYSALGQTGRRGIYRVPVDRSAPPTLLVEGRWPVFEAVQAAGSNALLVRLNADSTGRDIVSASSDGRMRLSPVAAGPFQERTPAISPDGRFLLYTSDESGRDEAYLRPLGGTGPVPVSGNGGSEPRWSPTGKEVYYWNRDTLFVVPVSVSPTLAIGARRFVLTGTFMREPFHSNYDIAPDGKSFVFIRSVESRGPPQLVVVLNWFDPRNRANTR